MTTGLKTPSNYYIALITSFPPRPITNEAELIATQTQINSILDKGKLTNDDRDYLKVLGLLVYDYENKHEPMPLLKGFELVQALLEESNLQPKDLIPIFETETAVLDILNGKRQLTTEQINKLAALFQLAPNAFFEVENTV
ncbi:MAG TPA: transcriptional regulator [Cyanobacteria bacterium UBA11162]|nr:transcriptional regulator [Cyanobacteria bacterium UBA12227]HAX86211.1 transcriptional regulator [Cyanobacteria bacterium UBA11370]HBL12968.1 transcriptional regulator [Cyanobacteria bacterium UBA11162]HBY81684.1 transcriptional regulator [Cyanobacteria bacterium UBA11148]